ncbi:MAG: zinc ABC transporter substrate-binding protein [Treponema sp.]|nr:zinc ABC transporter substrate-binding protein [Treponema sp.]
MTIMMIKRAALCAALGIALAACGGAGEGKPLLALSIGPQRFFADRISGGRVPTLVLLKSGQDAHSYEPGVRQLAALARAGVWVTSGAEFEIALRPKVEAAFPGIVIMDGTEGVPLRFVEEHHHHADQAASQSSPTASGIEVDRHAWLGREGALAQARQIRAAAILLDSTLSDEYTKNAKALEDEIAASFTVLKGRLAPLAGATVYVYHPAFGYFLDTFGIRQEAVEAGGKEPGPRALYRLMTQARGEGVKTLFVQAQFPAAPARTLAEALGGAVIPLDPLAEDWLANIRLMGEALWGVGSRE